MKHFAKSPSWSERKKAAQFALANARREKRLAETESLRKMISDAFFGVKLDGGIGFWEARGIDDHADAAALASLHAKDEKENWRRLAPEDLDSCNSSLSFFDAKGMRFHLPAYLIANLEGTYTSGIAFCLTHLSDYSVTQFALFSPAQRAAVRAFLLHLMDDPDEQFHRADIIRALADFWTGAPST